MASPNSRNNPPSWDRYERGGASRTGSVSSFGNKSFQSENEALLGRSVESAHDDGDWTQQLRRRRPSITNRLAALTDIGGVNSIRSFTRSWTRAASFPEVIPQRPSFIFAPDQVPIAATPDSGVVSPYEPEQQHRRREHDVEAGPSPSLIRQQLEAALQAGRVDHGHRPQQQQLSSRTASPEPAGSTSPLLHRQSSRDSRDGELAPIFRVGSHGTTMSGVGSIFAIPPHLATPPLVGSYRSGASGMLMDYGTVRSDASSLSRGYKAAEDAGPAAAAAALWREQQEAGGNVPDGELPPILVKEVEQDGKIVLAVEGQSTLPQTVFNSTNVLIGVGLLSLPMGFKYAGWICGMATLLLCALVTAWTARLLAKCMDLDPSLITFSDIAYISFGRNARIVTSFLFTLELIAASVALIVLFADSLDLLFPGLLSVTGWKMICGLILMPLNFLPLRLLSFTSFIGIFSCFTIVLILILDGLMKPTSPGSLIEPAKTYLFPANWLTLPLSFGLLMSPWGGHGVFPNIYRDMRHPYKYARAVKTTFTFTYLLDATTAVTGLLMFGDSVRDEITSNILLESSYPRALTALMCLCIGIIPLTKIPLNARPIVSTLELLLGLNRQTVAAEYDYPYSHGLVGRGMGFRGVMKVAVRVAVILMFLGIAVLFPAFDSIMAFMGSALCFTICVTLPIAFYLKLFGHEIPIREKMFAWAVMVISSLLSVVGTVWAFLPKSLIGAEPSTPEL
ncbi:amino acid transporter [Thermothelomyces thermophilus ATCC 42464]|uniref:Amino acid transporter n=1 Tax=Thermothelomyces thermophilus (strain ATCC 42464 / BCRC 31852 / DSM 1799) TaxID=573729 RepID=G2QE71_THET4|nr:amino acid transporter [Thermothelomyces thermophilus ATCC 42464]AEO57654.1 amino acid transporter [Thermothelomyces thermophilus ATCC 42464]